jgi:hypothetical protein
VNEKAAKLSYFRHFSRIEAKGGPELAPEEAFMRIRTIVLMALCGSVAISAVTPALADDDWRRHERHEEREHEGRGRDWAEHHWREQQWREQQWREQQWRERYYAPPVVVAPGYYAPPPVYYSSPSYYR